MLRICVKQRIFTKMVNSGDETVLIFMKLKLYLFIKVDKRMVCLRLSVIVNVSH